ncbi:MAG: flippase-like domain-containing protein [Actinobacteria bacterium]|nr:flippase-like domain-containing protein [Actinomycetota bacterium]
MSDLKNTETKEGVPAWKNIARGLIAAVAVSVLALLVLIFYTMDRSTWDAVSKISPFFLILALAVMILKWVANIYRTYILTKASGSCVSFFKATKVVFSGTFTGAVTPFHAAGIPAEIYFLSVYDIQAAQSTAIITTGTVMSVTLFVIMAPVVLLIAGAKVNAHFGIRTLLVGAGIVAVLFLLAVIYSMGDPHRMAGRILRWTPAWLKNKNWFKKGVNRFFNAVAHFSESLHTILHYRRRYLVIAALLTLVLWGSVVFVTPVILWGLGYPELFWKGFMAQLVVSYLLPFVPVPGESGFAEATFAGVFMIFVPENLIGVLALMWRFYTFYLPLLLSGIAFLLALRDSNKKLKKSIAKETAEQPSSSSD